MSNPQTLKDDLSNEEEIIGPLRVVPHRKGYLLIAGQRGHQHYCLVPVDSSENYIHSLARVDLENALFTLAYLQHLVQ
jgi:hypothetical protein